MALAADASVPRLALTAAVSDFTVLHKLVARSVVPPAYFRLPLHNLKGNVNVRQRRALWSSVLFSVGML